MESRDVTSEFHKVDESLVLVLVLILWSLYKCPENTTASHCLPQAHISTIAAQEGLQYKLGLTAAPKSFPPSAAVQSLLQLAGRDSCPGAESAPGSAALVGWGGVQGITKVVCVSVDFTRPMVSQI